VGPEVRTAKWVKELTVRKTKAWEREANERGLPQKLMKRGLEKKGYSNFLFWLNDQRWGGKIKQKKKGKERRLAGKTFKRERKPKRDTAMTN